jgi:hypothetical protein
VAQGVFNKTMATAVRWMPGSDTRLMVAFSDGALLHLDAEREDPPAPPAASTSHHNSNNGHGATSASTPTSSASDGSDL